MHSWRGGRSKTEPHQGRGRQAEARARKAALDDPRLAGTETTAIVLHIAADRAKEFESMFEADELPIWNDFTRRGRFLEASLVRAAGGSEERDGIQDYILHVVAADHDAHEEHDSDPRFRAFLAKAQRLQPTGPLVWFGDTVFERRSRR
jgi:hypothetical protein